MEEDECGEHAPMHQTEAWKADVSRSRRDISECDLISGKRVVSATCSAFTIARDRNSVVGVVVARLTRHAG